MQSFLFSGYKDKVKVSCILLLVDTHHVGNLVLRGILTAHKKSYCSFFLAFHISLYCSLWIHNSNGAKMFTREY